MRAGLTENWNRKGIFFLDMDTLKRGSWEDLTAMFSGVVIIESRCNFATNTVEYWAMSEAFEPVPDGCVLPEYECFIDYLDDGARRVRWLKDGVEPEPEAPKPIKLRLPDLRQIKLAVEDVLHRYRDNSDLLVDVDEWIGGRDWSNPAMATAAECLQEDIRKTVEGYFEGKLDLCYATSAGFCRGDWELVLSSGEKRWQYLVASEPMARYLAEWARYTWKAKDLKQGGGRVLRGGQAAQASWREDLREQAMQSARFNDLLGMGYGWNDALRRTMAMGVAQ